jgi:hypothetical protein
VEDQGAVKRASSITSSITSSEQEQIRAQNRVISESSRGPEESESKRRSDFDFFFRLTIVQFTDIR